MEFAKETKFMSRAVREKTQVSSETRGVDAINYLNVALRVVSVLCAAYGSCETFVFAYAVLGSVHYLTEIS